MLPKYRYHLEYNLELFEELKHKGVTIVKAPQKVFWGGYSGYVADPDHNYWEIAFNPFMPSDDL